MDTVIGTEGTYLSGGEQQRVALARAILKNAPIVVLADGKVAEEGSPGELLTKENGIFRHMAQLQSASAGWSI